MAKLFPRALPPMVKEAVIAAVIKLGSNGSIFILVETITAILAAAAPEMIPQISPITSQQKLETLSAFFFNLTAMFAPFTFLEFIE